MAKGMFALKAVLEDVGVTEKKCFFHFVHSLSAFINGHSAIINRVFFSRFFLLNIYKGY
jgi:hypothetical protein